MVEYLSVKVDYTKTLEELIKIANLRNPLEIDSTWFPEIGQGPENINVCVIELNTTCRTVKPEEVLAQIKKIGYRPANLAELLSFSAQFPEEQEKYPIVALTIFEDEYGNTEAPCIGSGGHQCGIDKKEGLPFNKRWFGRIFGSYGEITIESKNRLLVVKL